MKTVVCAVKTISWGIASCKLGPGDQGPCPSAPPPSAPGANSTPGGPGPSGYKQFVAKETEVYLRLIKWGLKAIDIYAVNGPLLNGSSFPTNGGAQGLQRPINTQGVRSKEEKEVLEHFAGAVSYIHY